MYWGTAGGRIGHWGGLSVFPGVKRETELSHNQQNKGRSVLKDAVPLLNKH